MQQRRYIIIEGGIGAGKTHLLKELEKKIHAKFIYEYIDEDYMGYVTLTNFINKNISLNDFQHYILDVWESKLSSLENNETIIFMERGPCGGAGFAKPTDFDSVEQCMCFYNRIQNINKKYNITKPIILNIGFDFNIDLLINLIFSSNDNLLIYINTPLNQQKLNMKIRGRKNEESYNDRYLMNVNHSLYDLYNGNQLLLDYLYDVKI